jgi:DNA-binding FadR family transcriptional regulator
MVADQLRERILRGDLRDGDLLPKEEELREQYPVAKPSLREAMRILETEGLVTVRRGNVGGAVVHRPSPTNAAYTLGLVLASRGVDVSDVARALREVEPSCVGLCAARRDRRRAVVPILRRLHKEALGALDDLVAVTGLSRQFHETMVGLCGNETLIVVAGALERLWSSHETGWAHRKVDPGDISIDSRRDALLMHERMIDLIDAGDEAGVRVLSAQHLSEVQSYPRSGDGRSRIDLAALRSA